MKRFVVLLLAVIFAFSLTPAAHAEASLDNFQKTAAYRQGQFSDVASGAWYADSVKSGYEYGLIKGTSDTTFSPDGNMTLAEAVTLAARLHSIYHNGTADFTQGSPWYQVYVDYAVANGMIRSGMYPDYNAKATRAQFAAIFAAALPDEALPGINNITAGSIPDVSGAEAYGPAVYKLYNAGILTGNDAYGTFAPASNIRRSEVAAIATRMADPGLRKTVSLKVAVTGISLDKTSLALVTGDAAQLTATVLPEEAADRTVTWSSSNTAVATVNNAGSVAAIGIGTATITAATANGHQAACAVTVKAGPVAVTGITLDKTYLTLAANASASLTATVTPFDAADKTVTWSSSNTSVARVNASGVVTAVKEGKATVTAQTGNGLTATCSVTVRPPAYDYLRDIAKGLGTYDPYIHCYEYRYYWHTYSGSSYTFDLVYNEKDKEVMLRSISYDRDVQIFTVTLPPPGKTTCSGTLAYKGNAWFSVKPATYTEDTLPTLSSYTGSPSLEYSITRLCGALLNLNLVAADILLSPAYYTVADLGFTSF